MDESFRYVHRLHPDEAAVCEACREEVAPLEDRLFLTESKEEWEAIQDEITRIVAETRQRLRAEKEADNSQVPE